MSVPHHLHNISALALVEIPARSTLEQNWTNILGTVIVWLFFVLPPLGVTQK